MSHSMMLIRLKIVFSVVGISDNVAFNGGDSPTIVFSVVRVSDNIAFNDGESPTIVFSVVRVPDNVSLKVCLIFMAFHAGRCLII